MITGSGKGRSSFHGKLLIGFLWEDSVGRVSAHLRKSAQSAETLLLINLSQVMMLLDRSQEMINHIICHLFALMKSIPASGAEMHTKPNARDHVFVCRSGETVIRTEDTARCPDSREC